MNKLRKDAQNFPLKSGRGISWTEWEDFIRKGTPRTRKCSLVLVFRSDLYLIVTTKSIQEREELLPYKTI